MTTASHTHRRVLRACLLPILALLGCVAASGTLDRMLLTETDDGRKVRLTPGAILEVRLAAQLGTGFSWQPPKTSILSLSKAVVDRNRDARPGAAEDQVFVFTAQRGGAERLHFEYRRPWEKDASPSRRFSIEVTVAGD